MIQRLLDSLSGFCASAGLTVNMDKTVWLVGGMVHRDFVAGTLLYRGSPIRRVHTVRYLGLQMEGHGLGSMV